MHFSCSLGHLHLANLKTQDGCTEYKFNISLCLIPSLSGSFSKLLISMVIDFPFTEQSDSEKSEQSVVSKQFKNNNLLNKI